MIYKTNIRQFMVKKEKEKEKNHSRFFLNNFFISYITMLNYLNYDIRNTTNNCFTALQSTNSIS